MHTTKPTFSIDVLPQKQVVKYWWKNEKGKPLSGGSIPLNKFPPNFLAKTREEATRQVAEYIGKIV